MDILGSNEKWFILGLVICCFLALTSLPKLLILAFLLILTINYVIEEN